MPAGQLADWFVTGAHAQENRSAEALQLGYPQAFKGDGDWAGAPWPTRLLLRLR